MKQLKKLSLEDQCMVHRYLYYVRSNPVISDYEYDMLEKKALKSAPDNHPLHFAGSDVSSHYSKKIVDVANTLI